MFRFLRGRTASPKKTRGAPPPITLKIGGRTVEVRRKAYRRSIGLTVHVSGRLRVSAPSAMPVRKIVAFIEAQHEWIESNLRKYEKLRDSHPRKLIREGETFPFLGRSLVLRFETEAGRAKYAVRIRGKDLVIAIPELEFESIDRSIEQRKLLPLLLKFYRKAGSEILGTRLSHFADQMNSRPSGVSFRSQKTRWGSCSSKGRISLNWRLVVAPMEVIDYVCVHELAHLRVYDHSQKFWTLVGSQIPDYSERRDWLRDHVYDADFLAPRSELHG